MQNLSFDLEKAFEQICSNAQSQVISSEEAYSTLVDEYFDQLLRDGVLEDHDDIEGMREILRHRWQECASQMSIQEESIVDMSEDILSSHDYIPVDLNSHLPKLIRDRVPEIMKEHQKSITYKLVSGSTYDQALRKKLIEETAELRDAKTQQEIIDQISDVLELIQTFVAFHTLDINEIKSHQKRKKEERGGYEKGVLLTSVEK